ncbi:MAG TPA: fenitrothion hydrolase [Solirubrobacterales bacterium]|nr:fenitrothion hydrolase [Solirubrobacterales bacterium]
MRARGLILAGGLGLAALAFPEIASAHALVGRQDLPVPTWLFAWGASLVLIVSFALLSVAWTEARLQKDEWRPLSGRLSAVVIGPVTQVVCGSIGVGLWVLILYAGFSGTDDPPYNFAIVFVFYTFWLGMVVISVLLGDVFRAFNPWRAVGRIFSGAFRMVAGRSAPTPFAYPDRLGRWPVVIGVLGFVWLELVSGGVAPSPSPQTVAIATAIYSAITFVSMALFGVEEWIRRGETFSGYFEMFSRLAPFEVRDGRLGIRKFLTGAPSWSAVPGTAALVLTSIAVTSFDGAQEGVFEGAISWTIERGGDIGLGLSDSIRLADSIWLAIVLAGVSSLYWLGVRGMHTVRGSPEARELGRSFAHTLIPIALAYLVAHYFSAFVYQEQAQFTYILSDPLGDGSDLFGTAGYGIDYGVIGSNTVWYVQVAALVIGHVTALTLAHDRALAVYEDVRDASRSQYFMLAVMVGFTCFGLYLLSQANA